MRPERGFTLIELMIVVAIIGILAGIAIPSYSEYLRRARLTEMMDQLSSMRVRLEQYYQDHRDYGSDEDSCGNAIGGSGIGTLTGESFNFTCRTADGGDDQTFVITATGKATAGMSGYTFTIDQANARRTTAFPGATVPKSCWIRSAGQSC